MDNTAILILGISLPLCSLLLVCACIALCVVCKTKEHTVSHLTLKKDNNLKDHLVEVAGDSDGLDDEFKQLEEVASNEVMEKTIETNIAHNRYNDILPYQGNTIATKIRTGVPPTTYINASMIKFPHLDQTFIATQAPKPNSFQNFWQLIVERKISVIVMITGLTEGNKKKADQYWPDEDNRTMDLENGMKVEHKEKSYQGTYFLRTMKVQDTAGSPHTVTQLQITKWLDLTAPDDTKILLDMVYKTRDLVTHTPGVPVLVHCSAGVGRTGTFICLYKLVEDYFNKKVRRLDPFMTVLEMRKQRMKMVQKPSQYRYIFSCTRDLVRQEEIPYYDNMITA